MMRLRILYLPLLLSVGCSAPQSEPVEPEPIDTAAALAGIEETRAAFAAALREGRYEDLGRLVTADVITVGPGSSDWEAMRQLGMERSTPFPYDSIVMRPLETVVVSDSVAWDFGTSQVYFTNAGGEVQQLEDTFLAILKKEADGVWRLHREVASSLVP